MHMHITAGQHPWHRQQECQSHSVVPHEGPDLSQCRFDAAILGDAFVSPPRCANPGALLELLVCSQLHQFNRDITGL